MIKHSALWSVAFRPWFLIAAALALLGIANWLGFLNGLLPIGSALTPALWHGELMIFGVFVSVLIGFAFTAVQNWTGIRSIHGWQLALASGSWLLLRLLVWSNRPDSLAIAIPGMALWWITVIGLFASYLWRAGNVRNLPILIILTTIGTLHCTVLTLGYLHNPLLALHLLHTALLVFALLSMVMGGRVIPMFTRNGVRLLRGDIDMPPPLAWLEKLVMVVGVSTVILFAAGYWHTFNTFTGGLMICLGLLNLARWLRWRGTVTLPVPLLWSLHLAYLMLATGLAILGYSLCTGKNGFTDTLHLLAISGIGLLMLSMMCRVSLGHTGRPLSVNRAMQVAFLILLTAGLARALAGTSGSWHTMINASGLMWLLVYGVFLGYFLRVWLKPRVD